MPDCCNALSCELPEFSGVVRAGLSHILRLCRIADSHRTVLDTSRANELL